MIETNSDKRTVAYRFEELAFSNGLNEYDDPLPGYNLRVVCYEYPIIKLTPKGIWIERIGGNKWINLNARKQWACVSKEEALKSFIHRKNKQIHLLKHQLEMTEKALRMTLDATGAECHSYRVILPNTIPWEKLARAVDWDYGL